MVKAKRLLAFVMQYHPVLQKAALVLTLVTAGFWLFGIDSISKPLAVLAVSGNLFVLGLALLDRWLITRELPAQ